MAIDWDAEVLTPVMGLFGEGMPGVPESYPIYTSRGGTPFRLIDAVFDEQYAQVQVNDAGEASTNLMPALGVRLALFIVAPAQNDTVVIPRTGKAYVVRDVQPDGHGHARLILMEAA